MIVKSTDSILIEDAAYQNFLKNNPGTGNLKVRATTASEAFPVKNVVITVSKVIGSNTVIFYEGLTDESGMINGIKLPTPRFTVNDLQPPNFTTYQLHAVYDREQFDRFYDISLCCSVGLVQYINITPRIQMEVIDSGN